MSGDASGVVSMSVAGKPTNTQEGKKESTATRLARLELAVGDFQDSLSSLETNVGALQEQVKVLEGGEEDLKGEVQGAVNELAGSLREDLLRLVREEVAKHVQSFNEKIEEFKGELMVCRAAIAGSAQVREAPKIKVPEPPKFNGKRDAKEIDNFVWSVERYFHALQIQDDASKITTATMYLSEDAILWWRRRESDEKKGTFHIGTWEEFKADFKKQFYPDNAEEIALKKLRALKHTGSIREYIQQYSSLLLEIEDMSENMSLLYFMDGLQRWAEQELKRRNVKTLAEAIAVAESLYEIRSEPRKERHVNKEADNNKEIGGGDSKSSTIRGDGTRAKEATHDRSRMQGRDKGKTFNCFLCGGPHMVRECPQRAKLSAMVMRYEEGESLEAHEPRRLGAMRLLNAGVVDKPTGLATATKIGEEPTLKATGVVSKEAAGLDATTNCEVEPTKKATKVAHEVAATNEEMERNKYKGNLLTVNGEVNGVHTRVLIDSGATHNYVALRVVRDMGIRYTKTRGELKAVNSSATPIYGMAHGVPIRLGKWKGKGKFMIVDMDDEDVVLGMEFIESVRPFKFGDGVITITSNGSEIEIKLAQEEGDAKIGSLRVIKAPRRRRQPKIQGSTNPARRRRFVQQGCWCCCCCTTSHQGRKTTYEHGYRESTTVTRTSTALVGENVTVGLPSNRGSHAGSALRLKGSIFKE